MNVSSIALRVADLPSMTEFYTTVLGLCEVERTGMSVGLSASGRAPVQLHLTHVPSSPARPPASPGLFHVAYLLPDRPSLGGILRRILAHGCPLQGAAHHGVSEALYLADPEGNGIELSLDLPEELWPRRGALVEMGTAPLDVEALAEEGTGREMDPRTRIGHVHLQVSDLARSEEFYSKSLGLDVTQRGYPGALFLSSGGYHHHLALNIWRSRGAPPPPAGALGLESFSLIVPGAEAFRSMVGRAEAAKRLRALAGTSATVLDPDNLTVHLALS